MRSFNMTTKTLRTVTTTQPRRNVNAASCNRSTWMVTTMRSNGPMASMTSVTSTPSIRSRKYPLRPRKRAITTIALGALLGVFAATAVPTLAGGSGGNAQRMQSKSRVVVQGLDQRPTIWTDPGRNNGHAGVLNPAGDLNGDLYPEVLISPHDPRDIWVVWGKFTGVNHDLAWSRWEGDAWREIDWVDYKPRNGNDFDPVLKISNAQRAFVVWWTEFDGQGEIYLSMFLQTHWLAPFRVSPPDVDSRRPLFRRISPQAVEVEFETPSGTMFQVVGRVRPHTITDDINPQMHWSLRGDPVNIAPRP
jgi:hypothetical protein